MCEFKDNRAIDQHDDPEGKFMLFVAEHNLPFSITDHLMNFGEIFLIEIMQAGLQ